MRFVSRTLPHMNANAIRRLLQDAFPFYKKLSSNAVSNIRRSAFRALDDPQFDVNMDPFQLLKYMPSGIVAADEISPDDPRVMQPNFGNILAEVMRNSEYTWKALGLLKEMKSKIPGFDYRVNYDEENLPSGIMWIFPEQRQFLIRFGSILFLDMRKAPSNNLNFPYCSLTMMDPNRSPIVGPESLVCAVSLANYQWLLLSTNDKNEPKFRLPAIKLIFGNQFLKQSLLDNLGISDTCLLRGDTYHLYAASDCVFLRNFTANFYSPIKPFLSGMLWSKTKPSWDTNYQMAKTRLMELGAASKVPYLDGIYQSPSYYSGYVLAGIEGHCEVHGSSHAEQNHSSVASQLADCTVMSLEKNAEELFRRQSRLLTQRREQQINWYVVPHIPATSTPLESRIELAAKKVLDKRPFHDLLLKKLRMVKYWKIEMQPRTQNSEKIYNVLPIEHTMITAEPVNLIQVICEGKRCSCTWRIAYNAQCKHELLVDAKFYPEKWDIRWYNDMYWNNTCNTREVDDVNYDSAGSANNGENYESDCSHEIPDEINDVGNHTNLPLKPCHKEVQAHTSWSVMMACQTLCNLIQHDKARIQEVCIVLETMINRSRK